MSIRHFCRLVTSRSSFRVAAVLSFVLIAAGVLIANTGIFEATQQGEFDGLVLPGILVAMGLALLLLAMAVALRVVKTRPRSG
jgi:uncharacterized Tic20 family protein